LWELKFKNKIIYLQLFFFSLFILTLIIPFIKEEISGLSFIRFDIFAYIFSFKLNLLFFVLVLIIIIELFFGRIFCAFICPLGNLITFFDWLFNGIRKKIRKQNYRGFTFIPAGIFLLIIVLKFFDINIIGFFDPLSIIHRFFTLTFSPILKLIFKSHFISIPFFVSVSYSLIFIIALSFFGERIWCKYICPLGFIHRIFSIPSKYIRVVNNCTNCMVCVNLCPMNAIDIKDPTKYDKTLCILCFRCVYSCVGATNFKFQFKNKQYSSTRRNFLKFVLTSFVFFNFFKAGKKDKRILRPPGATEKSIQNCIRCMECVKSCPTNVIQPAGFNKGVLNLFTPEFRTDISYCDYECNLCGKVCPTNSIKLLPLKMKQKWKIGVAVIDPKLCIVWSSGVPCLVCEEHCPVPEKAIKVKMIKRGDQMVGAPVVDNNLCIGCGLCQNKCPAEGSAIKVLPLY